MSKLTYKYFWMLGSNLPNNVLGDYKDAVGNKKSIRSSKLFQGISLAQEGCPINPQLFITPTTIKMFKKGRVEDDFLDELSIAIEFIEKSIGKGFGDSENPATLSIVSDRIGNVKNIGINERNLSTYVQNFGQAKAYAMFIEFLETFSMVGMKAPFVDFREKFSLKINREDPLDGLEEINKEDFLSYVEEYKGLVSNNVKKPFPKTLEKCLMTSLWTMLRGVSNPEFEIFLKAEVSWSQYAQSVEGVAYSKNPYTGEKDIYGVYVNGEDGVKGLVEDKNNATKANSLQNRHPKLYTQLKSYLPVLERIMEYAVEVAYVSDENGNLYIQRINRAELTSKALVKAAVDLNSDGIIGDLEAALMMSGDDVEMILHPTLDDESRESLMDYGSEGVTASPGTATGKVFFKMEEAIKEFEATGSNVILIADELLVSDAPGLGIIKGLMTKSSGLASHAAVMARSNGIPCVIGYQNMDINYESGTAMVNGHELKAGEIITLEAADKGKLYQGEGKVKNVSHEEGIVKETSLLISRALADFNSPLKVLVNINTHIDARAGMNFGAEGVGLCRTENMLTKAECIRELRKIIFTPNPNESVESFKRLEEIQYVDFKDIFRVMADKKVQIRLMDMPLHELIPATEDEYKDLAEDMNLNIDEVKQLASNYHEANPMLGLRACRFGIITPEVYNLQIRAIVRAVYELEKEGINSDPGIMFPLVFNESELHELENRVREIESKIREELHVPYSDKIKFRVGTMVELPSAALSTDKFASVSEFFAFGTNDLTQTSLGISRTDSENYLPFYIENKIIDADPFDVLADPVKELIELAVARGRRVRKDAFFGICGEQGGDVRTLQFGLESGLNYVSCSAYRVLPTKTRLLHLLHQLNERKKSQVSQLRQSA
jgi:pyruvate,orthophosphate dikinase